MLVCWTGGEGGGRRGRKGEDRNKYDEIHKLMIIILHPPNISLIKAEIDNSIFIYLYKQKYFYLRLLMFHSSKPSSFQFHRLNSLASYPPSFSLPKN